MTTRTDSRAVASCTAGRRDRECDRAPICKRRSGVAIADLDPAKSEAAAGAIRRERVPRPRFHRRCRGRGKRQDRRSSALSRTFGKLTTLVNVAAAVTPDGTVETALASRQWNQAIASISPALSDV